MYRFELQALLNHRQFIEETLQKELALLKRSVNHNSEKLRDLERDRRRHQHQLKNLQQTSLKIAELSLYLHYIERVSREIDLQRQRLAETRRKFHKKREELLVAVKDRKALENLKEKGLKIHRQTLLRKEREFMDEIAGIRARKSQ